MYLIHFLPLILGPPPPTHVASFLNGPLQYINLCNIKFIYYQICDKSLLTEIAEFYFCKKRSYWYL